MANGSSGTAYQSGDSAARLTGKGANGSVNAVETIAPIAAGTANPRNSAAAATGASVRGGCRSDRM